MSSISKKFVPSTDGSLIYAEATGDPTKPALVLVPGLTMTTQVFDKQFLDEEMRKELFMIRYDTRGHGQSSKPETEEAYASKLWADDFAAVCKAFEVEKPVFAGWSFGGTIITDICTYIGPEAMSGAILMAGPPSYAPEAFVAFLKPEAVIGGLQSNDATVRNEFILQFADDLFFFDSIPFQVRCAWMGGITFVSTSVAKLFMSRTQDTKALDEAGKGNKLKVLCIHGDKDALVSGAAVVELLQREYSFSNVEVFEIKETGHAFFYEKPEETNKKLLEFVNRVTSTM
ncbi:hypothetical protein VKT23_009829 [Stygiomarasmius scandens]|uniref:AB hydrolase-1 domain-containing protein n=1 Tax=Marasmiellus scandens TaxID=2682957 RepID=A0ABR1JIQ4_9AGAR